MLVIYFSQLMIFKIPNGVVEDVFRSLLEEKPVLTHHRYLTMKLSTECNDTEYLINIEMKFKGVYSDSQPHLPHLPPKHFEIFIPARGFDYTFSLSANISCRLIHLINDQRI